MNDLLTYSNFRARCESYGLVPVIIDNEEEQNGINDFLSNPANGMLQVKPNIGPI